MLIVLAREQALIVVFQLVVKLQILVEILPDFAVKASEKNQQVLATDLQAEAAMLHAEALALVDLFQKDLAQSVDHVEAKTRF